MIPRYIFNSIVVILTLTAASLYPDPVMADSHLQGTGVRVIRDKWGVPHIFADDEWSLFYGLGDAAAEVRKMTLIK